MRAVRSDGYRVEVGRCALSFGLARPRCSWIAHRIASPCSTRRPVANPRGGSAARLPSVPAPGALPRGMPRRVSRLVERACPGVWRSAKRGSRSSVSPQASMARTAPGGRSPGICRELLYATLLKFGLAEGEYRADPRRWTAPQGRGDPQRGQMPAAGEQAGAAGNRDVPAAISKRRWPPCATSGAGRARADRPCCCRACARRSAVPTIRPRRRDRTRRRPNLLSSYHCSRYNQNTAGSPRRCSKRVRARDSAEGGGVWRRA